MPKWVFVKGAKHKYTQKETLAIKRKLGIPLICPLPKCPAKTASFVRLREKAGDFSHSDPKHFCHLCACKRTAGYGTAHLGYGWCYVHENTKRRKHYKETFAMKHLEALQQRDPSLYHHADAFFNKVEQQGKHSLNTQTLESEIKLLRATVLKMMGKINDNEATAGHTALGTPLIMTDKDKISAIKQLTEAIGKLVKTDCDINADNVITLDAFKMWMAAFARAVKEQFPAKDDQVKFVEASKKAGEPRRG